MADVARPGFTAVNQTIGCGDGKPSEKPNQGRLGCAHEEEAIDSKRGRSAAKMLRRKLFKQKSKEALYIVE